MNNTIQELTGQVAKWIELYFPAICAGVMAAAINILMGVRAGDPSKRNVTGGAICGLIATGCYSFAVYCGMPPEAGIFFGGFLGFVGPDGIKEFFVAAGNVIKNRKTGGLSDANKQ